MPNFAIIRNGIVENIAVYDAQPTIPGATVVRITTQRASPGDSYDGANFTARVPSAAELEAGEAGGRMIGALPLLRAWAGDAKTAAEITAMTAAERIQRQAVMETRVAALARLCVALIRERGVNDAP